MFTSSAVYLLHLNINISLLFFTSENVGLVDARTYACIPLLPSRCRATGRLSHQPTSLMIIMIWM